jgi:REP element-mobilizing transposase RayT
MEQAAYVLNSQRRRTVLDAIRQVCAHREWTLIAAHVRTNHVHVVLDASITPEAVMHDLKAYASRLLNEGEDIQTKRWTRHGSTQYLWKKEDVEGAVRYVVEGQGDAMAAYLNTAP